MLAQQHLLKRGLPYVSGLIGNMQAGSAHGMAVHIGKVVQIPVVRVYTLKVRGQRALIEAVPPAWVVVAFALFGNNLATLQINPHGTTIGQFPVHAALRHLLGTRAVAGFKPHVVELVVLLVLL